MQGCANEGDATLGCHVTSQMTSLPSRLLKNENENENIPINMDC